MNSFGLAILMGEPRNCGKLLLLEDFKPEGLADNALCVNVLWSTGPEHYDLLKPLFSEPRPIQPLRIVPVNSHNAVSAGNAPALAASGSAASLAPTGSAPAAPSLASSSAGAPSVSATSPSSALAASSANDSAAPAKSGAGQSEPGIGPELPGPSSLALVKSESASGLNDDEMIPHAFVVF